MFDLGTSLIASVARDPHAIAIIDAGVRLTYREWFGKISALVGAFDQLGLKRGDHILTALQNRWEAATLHWSCQFAGVVITPVNWRSSASELDFYLDNAEAKAIAYEDASAAAVAHRSRSASSRAPRVAIHSSAGSHPASAAVRHAAMRSGTTIQSA